MRQTCISALAALSLTAMGCAPRSESVAEAATNTLTIIARNYGYDLPASIPGGLTVIRLVNQGSELHHAHLFKLEAGHTAAEFNKALASGAPPAWVMPYGGPNAVEPGDTTSSIQMLEPGHYAIVCVIPGPDGIPHFAKGMATEFDVTKGPARAEKEPEADAILKTADYAFGLSTQLHPGRRVIRMENDGPQPHEAVLVRLAQGKTVADVAAWAEKGFAGAPPARFMGGVVTIVPGQHAFFSADFTPGEYGLLCFIPDAKDGKPHLAHGMMSQFHVGAEASATN